MRLLWEKNGEVSFVYCTYRLQGAQRSPAPQDPGLEELGEKIRKEVGEREEKRRGKVEARREGDRRSSRPLPLKDFFLWLLQEQEKR